MGFLRVEGKSAFHLSRRTTDAQIDTMMVDDAANSA
jgi:hypothetical protein